MLDLGHIGLSVVILALVSLDPDETATGHAFVAYVVHTRPEVTNVLLLAWVVSIAVLERTRTLEQRAKAICL